MRPNLSNCASVSIVALAFVMLASPAWAQRAAGPYAGVLGASDESSARHTFIVRGSLFGAWDDIESDTDVAAARSRFLRSGLSGGASGGLVDAHRSGRVTWVSSATSSMRVYGTQDDAVAATFSGRSSVQTRLSSRLSLSLSGGWTYSPYYELAPSVDNRFTGVGASASGFGVATAAERNTSADGAVGLTARLSRRDTIDLGVEARRFDFLDQENNSIDSYGARANWKHQLTRSLGVHAGFGRDQATYELADTRRVTNDTIDVGVDYGDTLEFSRRTALSFSTSTSAVRWNDETNWRINGDVALARAFGRSGSGSVQYSRNTEFRPGFREPLLTDTVSGGFSDQIGRRTSWSAVVGYVHGAIGFDREAAKFNTHNATGRVTTALTRHLGVYADYTYYRYRVPSDATVFTFLPRFTRHSITAGLTLWAPLINDTRPPRGNP